MLRLNIHILIRKWNLAIEFYSITNVKKHSIAICKHCS